MVEQSRRSVPGRRRVLLAVTAATVGAALIGFAAAADAAPAKPAVAKCAVNFTSSDDTPVVGQNITLRWTTSGADQLIASWTSAPVPFNGSQVTTKDTVGPAAFQVTGLKSGQYCGGGVVNVVFTAAGASSSASPAATTPTTTSPPSSSSAVAPTSSVTTPTSSAVAYPAQSPTSGTPVPWYEQPLNLLVVGLLSLLGSVALFNRERVRAVLVRRH